MQRVQTFRRRLFASVSALSLILCLATVGLWVRSYWQGARLSRVSANIYTNAFAVNGRLVVDRGTGTLPLADKGLELRRIDRTDMYVSFWSFEARFKRGFGSAE